jgi:mannose-1-phosphate guanylyltransferase
MKNYVLVMAGGKGTRFWPLSTDACPKQYLSLSKGESQSLLQLTLARFENFIPANQRFVITTEDQVLLAKQQTSMLIGNDHLILEPEGRNTAPAIFLGLLSLIHQGAMLDDFVCIMAADHHIETTAQFQHDVKVALKLANKNKVVTLGIPVTKPHTGYGYIKRGGQIEDLGHVIDQFVEKPNREKALEYHQSGHYLWNAGNFVAQIGVLLDEFKEHVPSMAKDTEAILECLANKKSINSIYQNWSAISIDYAVMEKSKKTAVVPVTFEWNDLGSWDALAEIYPAVNGNTLVGVGEGYVDQAQGNIIYYQSNSSREIKKKIVLSHVNDLMIIENDEYIMIIPKDRAQDIKKVREHFVRNNK